MIANIFLSSLFDSCYNGLLSFVQKYQSDINELTKNQIHELSDLAAFAAASQIRFCVLKVCLHQDKGIFVDVLGSETCLLLFLFLLQTTPNVKPCNFYEQIVQKMLKGMIFKIPKGYRHIENN